MLITRPLEFYRHQHALSIADFAQFLAISEKTYRRLQHHPERVREATKRRVLERLGVPSPYLVHELVPPPSEEEVTKVMAALEEADRLGGLALDPVTLEPTGEIFDTRGNLLGTYHSKTEKPWS